MTQEERTLTVSWEDPRPLAEAGRGLSGLEFLQKILTGELRRPPIAALLNFELVEVREDTLSSRSSPQSITTIRLALCTAVWPPLFWIRRWDARFNRCCPPEQATPHWKLKLTSFGQ